MINRDVRITANEVVKLFGKDAVIHAVMRAKALRKQGDEEGYAVWNGSPLRSMSLKMRSRVESRTRPLVI